MRSSVPRSRVVPERRRSAAGRPCVRVLLATLVSVATLVAAACTPSVPDSSTSGGDKEGANAATAAIVVGTTADVINFNPLVGNSRTDSWVTNLMYPKLMQMDVSGKKSALVATKWGYEDGGRTAWMELRDDLTWSDGTPLTAKDVAFTITAIAKEKIGTVAGLIPAFQRRRPFPTPGWSSRCPAPTARSSRASASGCRSCRRTCSARPRACRASRTTRTG